jgi:hypothetical protein
LLRVLSLLWCMPSFSPMLCPISEAISRMDAPPVSGKSALQAARWGRAAGKVESQCSGPQQPASHITSQQSGSVRHQVAQPVCPKQTLLLQHENGSTQQCSMKTLFAAELDIRRPQRL